MKDRQLPVPQYPSPSLKSFNLVLNMKLFIVWRHAFEEELEEGWRCPRLRQRHASLLLLLLLHYESTTNRQRHLALNSLDPFHQAYPSPKQLPHPFHHRRQPVTLSPYQSLQAPSLPLFLGSIFVDISTQILPSRNATLKLSFLVLYWLRSPI